MTLVLLLRHAESTWNRAGKWQGRADPELTQEGREAAAAVAQQLPRVFTRIVSSPLRRAAETAELLGRGQPAQQIELDSRLVERDLGSWEGLTRNEAAAHFPQAWQDLTKNDHDPDEWEARSSTDERVRSALSTQIDGPVLMISHGGPLQCLSDATTRATEPFSNLEGVWTITHNEELELLGRQRFGSINGTLSLL